MANGSRNLVRVVGPAESRNKNRIGFTSESNSEEEQLALNVDVEGWTPEALILWLDRQVRRPDIRQSELIRWLRDLAGHLIDVRGMHISALMRAKFLLARTQDPGQDRGHTPEGV